MNRAKFRQLRSFAYPHRVASGCQRAGAVPIAINCNNRGLMTSRKPTEHIPPRAPSPCVMLVTVQHNAYYRAASALRNEARLKFGE